MTFSRIVLSSLHKLNPNLTKNFFSFFYLYKSCSRINRDTLFAKRSEYFEKKKK